MISESVGEWQFGADPSTVTIGIGELHASRNNGDSLVARGLGSCVGVVLIDAVARCAGMAHVQLPETFLGPTVRTPWGGADRAMPELLRRVLECGGRLDRLRAVLAGGSMPLNDADLFRIGEKNSAAVVAALREWGVPIVAESMGGTGWRTLRLEVASGRVWLQDQSGMKELYHGV